jgi:hypothetical protein
MIAELITQKESTQEIIAHFPQNIKFLVREFLAIVTQTS